jgi:hypothetical protein
MTSGLEPLGALPGMAQRRAPVAASSAIRTTCSPGQTGEKYRFPCRSKAGAVGVHLSVSAVQSTPTTGSRASDTSAEFHALACRFL